MHMKAPLRGITHDSASLGHNVRWSILGAESIGFTYLSLGNDNYHLLRLMMGTPGCILFLNLQGQQSY